MSPIMFSTGHGEYSYPQSSYGEQGYDRSFDESSQHYYEGGTSNFKPYVLSIFLYKFTPQLVQLLQMKTITTCLLMMYVRVHMHLQVTLSTVNSRLSISRALASSSPSVSSNTLLNKATEDNHKDTVRKNNPQPTAACTYLQINTCIQCIPFVTGSGQGGSSQYSQYQQGQSQQYGSYRSSQGGPGPQTQRPYAYEQVHH